MLLQWKNVADLTQHDHSLGCRAPQMIRSNAKFKFNVNCIHFFNLNYNIFQYRQQLKHLESPLVSPLTAGATWIQLQRDYSSVSIKKKTHTLNI